MLTAKRPIPSLLDTPATPPLSGLISNIPAPQASCISDTPSIYHCMHHPLFIPLCVISFLSYPVSSIYLFYPFPSDYQILRARNCYFCWRYIRKKQTHRILALLKLPSNSMKTMTMSTYLCLCSGLVGKS